MKFSRALFFLTGFLGIFFLFKEIDREHLKTENSDSMTASVFFTQSTPTATLHSIFNDATKTGRKVNVLIVPGHEPDFGGAEYQNIKERDLNAELALDLVHYLAIDNHYNVILARTRDEWNPDLQHYFATHDADIQSFIRDHKMEMAQLTDEGKLTKLASSTPHNDAPEDVAFRLFGTNKWANENSINIILHLHFNDSAPRPVNAPGEYNGFTLYVPEHQYSNSEASIGIAKNIFARLSKMFPVSNLPEEKNGVIEDQDLIATGAANTVDAASILIEYGYVYEPQFKIPSVRSLALNELAFRTYLGLSDFFGEKPIVANSYDSTLLPYEGTAPVEKTKSANKEVFAFQAALIDRGLYPPKNFSANDCPLSGLFGSCTKAALAEFQQKFNITNETGFVGVKTRQQLKNLFKTSP